MCLMCFSCLISFICLIILLCLLCLLCLLIVSNPNTNVMKIIFKVLIISVLCLFFESCKCSSDVTKEERKDSTDDVVDEQRQDYEDAMDQRNN